MSTTAPPLFSAPSSIETVNPATGEKVANYDLTSAEKVNAIAKKSKETFTSSWGKTSVAERTEYFEPLAKALRTKKSEYAEIMTREMGKPITQAEAEVEKCAWAAEVYAEKTEEWLKREFVSTDAKESYVEHDPLGVILSIMPWNFPFWQVMRFAIPALAAGNVSILRHSNICPGSALAIKDAFDAAGFPEGVFSIIITGHDIVADLIASEYVSGVSLTGSVEAGRRIAELASRNFKKFVLELGGSDPFIVLEDAEIEKAAKVGAEARLLNSGQSCICAKRFIIAKPVVKEFTERFVSEFSKKKVGNPMDRDTDVGPLAYQDQVLTISSQVTDAVDKKARVLIGGNVRTPGAYYMPTVLDHLDHSMKVVNEEVFGPVAPILEVEDDEDAIRIANDSEFGLGSSLWTQDLEKAKRLATKLESGMVFVNSLVKSDPRMPFGGIKKSGVGRELSKYGLKEFTNIKSINVYEIAPADEKRS